MKAPGPTRRRDRAARCGLAGLTPEGLAALAVPTPVVTGADDRLVPPENRGGWRAAPGAALCVIPDSAHVFFLRAARGDQPALLAFFAKHEPAWSYQLEVRPFNFRSRTIS
jgi:pimeloyl-ACP methyl ester carboxylesterase